MLFRRQAEQVLEHNQQKKNQKGKGMRWWDLSLIGTGAVIGAGFFLGTALSIHRAGPALLINYLLGGLTAFLVFSALADMSVNDPQRGSFRVYARKAFGPSLGFMSGWMYWLAGVLIMSSEVAALSIFTRFWFPGVQVWVFAGIYAILGLGINLLGVKDFGRVESWFGLLKTSSLVIFILFGLLFISGLIAPALHAGHPALGSAANPWLPGGLSGAWSAMIFVLFSYGGIEVMGILSCELKHPGEIRTSGRVMLASLTLIYTLALLFVFLMIPQQSVSLSESPFVSALSIFGFGFIESLLNLLIISAAFSTMVGALFAVTNVLVSLAEDGDAPHGLEKRNSRGVPLSALSLTGIGLAVAVLVSFLLPNTVYEYLTTAAGVMLILNWLIILSSQIKNSLLYERRPHPFGFRMPGYPYSSYAAMAVIILTIGGALIAPGQRPGVLISLGLAALIFITSQLHRQGKLCWLGLSPQPARKPDSKDQS
ncbi:MAG TPA: amino acid permease [Syntrophomonadaceae bacterium]|nr:amino acid permease [Syntrophomonadaceae bacterium]